MTPDVSRGTLWVCFKIYVITGQLLKSRPNLFESEGKAGELLAQQARTTAASGIFTNIKSPPGVVLTDLKHLPNFTQIYILLILLKLV